MSIRSERPSELFDVSNMDDVDPHDLGEGSTYSTSSEKNPLRRNLVVSIRASLNDLCLSKEKSVWRPSQNALNAIFQQKKFTSLDGSTSNQGDLKSMMLHDMKVQSVTSTFPIGAF
jgi:hypothetical protein